MRTIVFTDLDGTLLDPATYSVDGTKPAHRLIRDTGAIVVFVSSKTRPEIEVWRRRLGNEHPFVVENGGAIYVPDNYFGFAVEGNNHDSLREIALGTPYREVRRRFTALRERLQIGVRGFGDMTVNEVASLTGLSLHEAGLAQQRAYSEPFVFPQGPDERFLRTLEGEKLRWTQGRFFHVMGNHHKGKAVDLLHTMFEREYRGSVMTVGIGDSLNDLPLLLSVDRPVLVRNSAGVHDPRIRIPGLLRTRGRGPEGWNEAVLELVKQSATG